MEINLYFNDDSKNLHIANFCQQSKKLKFNFHKLSDIKLTRNQRKIIFLKENLQIESFKNKLKNFFFNYSTNTCFFLPKKFSNIDFGVNSNYIYYPIKFIDFQNKLFNFFIKQKASTFNIELINDNTLFNFNNKKQVHLTEIEAKIISLLFDKKLIEKKFLNYNILKQSPLADSKSLESHLYRLRKKLIKIDSKRKIVLIEKKGLKLV